MPRFRIFNAGGLVDEVQRRVEPTIEGGNRGAVGAESGISKSKNCPPSTAGRMDKAGSGLVDVYLFVKWKRHTLWANG